jgi:predicted signal transduction protein with EAL and GGDEF domain
MHVRPAALILTGTVIAPFDLISQVTILQTVALIESSGIDPRRIIIEVTETALMQDYEQVQDSLRTLRSMGLKVALDDFGSGQSSLSYVHQLSLDKIKIDRGFIRNIATQPATSSRR